MTDRTASPRRLALYALTVAPFVVAAGRAIRNDWFPIGDSALLYLRTADVGTRHHPLLGSWSSASLSLGRNINNPGPLYDDLVAPFAHLFPVGVGNVIGVAAINVAFVLLAALGARRIGGPRWEAWTLLVSAALAWSLGSEVLFDIFQAHALLFPFLAALVLGVGAMTGHQWTWPWLVGVWSVILQTHISYAYIGVVVIATAVGVVATTHRERPTRTTMVWVAVVTVIASVQPVIEQFTADGEGNLSRLAKSAGGTDVAVGAGNAFRMVAAVFALPPWWSRWGFADTIQPAGAGAIPWLPGWPAAVVSFAILVTAVSVSTWWARRAHRPVLFAVDAIALAGLVGSVVALSRLTIGPVGLAAHHTRWLFVLALWCHAAVAATVWTKWAGDGLVRRSGPVVTAVLAVFCVANLPQYTQAHGPLADTDTMPALRRVFAELDRLEGLDPVLYRTDNLRVYEPYSSAIMAQLVDRGVEFRVDQEVMVRQLGPARRADGSEPVVVSQYQGWEAYVFEGCVLARVSSVGPEGERRLAERASELEDPAAGLDVSAVPGGAGTDERDADLANAIMSGDRDAVHRAIVEGWYGWWIDHGLVEGDAATVDALLAARPEMMEWVGSTFVLSVEGGTFCDGSEAGR